MTVKALYPVWKTWWAKWNDVQRTAFNEARAQGLSLNEAAALAHKTKEVEQTEAAPPAPAAPARAPKPRAKKKA
jgi:hypothetical protein